MMAALYWAGWAALEELNEAASEDAASEEIKLRRVVRGVGTVLIKAPRERGSSPFGSKSITDHPRKPTFPLTFECRYSMVSSLR